MNIRSITSSAPGTTLLAALLTTTLAAALVACGATAPPTPDAPPPPAQADAPPQAPTSQPASGPSDTAGRVAAATARLEAQGPTGRAVLRSIDAHGGLAAWYDGRALRFRYDYRPVGGQGVKNTLQTVELATSRVYHDVTEPTSGVLAWDGAQAWSRLEDPTGFPVRFWALTPYYFVAMPFVLGDPGVVLTPSDDDPAAVGLPPCDVIKVTFEAGTGDAPDDYYVVYLSKEDGRLLATRYVVTWKPFAARRGDQPPSEKILYYEDFQPAGPLTMARTHTFHRMTPEGTRGELATVAKVAEVTYKADFDAGRLTAPEGAVVDTSLDEATAP